MEIFGGYIKRKKDLFSCLRFVTMEEFFTALFDEFPGLPRKWLEFFIGIICFISYLIGLLCVAEGGMNEFQICDFYSASGLGRLILIFECIAVSWDYVRAAAALKSDFRPELISCLCPLTGQSC